jgi:hypothetical protein
MLLLVALSLVGAWSARAETILFSQGFEGPGLPDDWDADRGIWEIGHPAHGPGRAHEGENCAAVGLNVNYPANADSRLVRLTPFLVPPKSQNPRLRFWHWFSINSGGACFQRGDFGVVQIRPSNGDWTTISPEYYDDSDWTRASVDLGAYAGQSVQIAFYFYSNCSGESAGWFIDEVALVTGSYALSQGEGFENGLVDWAPDRGHWIVGSPTNGPGRAHTGTNCAAIVLDGTYPANVSSMFISPRMPVPSATQNPRLQFWHWFSIASGGACFQRGDYGQVFARTNGGEWTAISPEFYDYSDWSVASLDLRAFAESTIQVGFYFYANCSGASSGWFVDEIGIVSGSYSMANPEGFETGLGAWAPDRGNWTVGTPTNGPQRAHTGANCAAIVLDGTYPAYVSSMLIGPWTTVPPVDSLPRLRFWHWFSINSGGACFQRGDYGQVFVRTNGGEWTAVSPEYYNVSDWTRASLDLSAYACQMIQVGFYFYSNCSGSSDGWFIDDVEIFPREQCPDMLPPCIISAPQSLVNCVGSSATFCVKAGCGGSLRYQWRFNGEPIVGATNACHTIDNVQLQNAGDYTVEVSNPYGSIVTTPNSLGVSPVCVNIELYAGLTISHAVVGRSYRVEYVQDLVHGPNDWIPLTTITATATEFRWYDPTPAREARRFYRVIPE